MPVTIMYQGSPLSFPNLDSPDEAYKSLGEAAPTVPNQGPLSGIGQAPASADAPQTDVSHLDASKGPKDIDPALLQKNPDWLAASRSMYANTQGHAWNEKDGNAALAEWGLDRMARFNYNLPLMGLDALALKNAPPEMKKSFMYMLDTFEKTNYSLAGAGRFAKYAAMDPTTYVGLSTFGVGAAAAETAKLTTIAGVKAALKVGVVGGIEGGIFGGANARLEQEARVNADGQKDVDYGRVAEGAGIGAGAGALLAPLLSVGLNHLHGKAPEAAPHVPEVEAPTSSAIPPTGPAIDPAIADPARAIMEREQAARNAQAPTLHPVDQEYLSLQARKGELDTHLSSLPEGDANAADRLNRLQAVEAQLADKNLSPTSRKALSDRRDQILVDTTPEKLKADAAPIAQRQAAMSEQDGIKARLTAIADEKAKLPKENLGQTEPIRRPSTFEELPEGMKSKVQEILDNAAKMERNVTEGEAPKRGKLNETADTALAPAPDAKIGGEHGPSILDLQQMLKDVGSKVDTEAVRGWQRMANTNDPLRRALSHLSTTDAKDIVRQLGTSAMTEGERRGFGDAVIGAQNLVASTIKSHLDMASQPGISDTMKALYQGRAVAAEHILKPLKLLASTIASEHGSGLNHQKQNLFKGDLKHIDTDSVLRGKGIDPSLASTAQRADALSEWIDGHITKLESAESDTRVLSLRDEIANSMDRPASDVIALWDKLAETRRTIADEQNVGMNRLQRSGAAYRKFAADVGSFLAMTVLSPSSVTVNLIANALQVFSRPTFRFIANPADKFAFHEMTAAYGAMFQVGRSSLAQAKLAFELEASLLAGTESKWVENNAHKLGEAGQNNVSRWMGRNMVRIWMRLMNAGDEMFQQMAYAGWAKGDATGKAMLAARERGLSTAETKAFVAEHISKIDEMYYTKTPDASTIGMLREAGIKQGYSGDNLKLYVQNQLNDNSKLLRRASNEQGMSYTNDLLFKTEFSGKGSLSSLAKGYEGFIAAHPEMRIVGQLFFRTPVRVFEAGLRLTPIVQFMPGTKFMTDLAGHNGMARQVRARGELIASYGITTSVVTAFSTGAITGSGYGMDYKVQRKMEDAGWRPYSIKVGDKYISYRNYDPFSTPMKIIVNAMERLQHLDYQQAQGVYDQKPEGEKVFGYVAMATGSILGAIKDANLTSGVGDIIDFFNALSDPEKNEKKFMQMFKSKAQLLVPNAVRKGVKSFGDGQNVATDPSTYDQVIESIINPGSKTVTDQFDALGHKRAPSSQGFFPYIGLDAASKEARSRGLDEKDQYSLGEIAKMSVATGRTFEAPGKTDFFRGADLKQQRTLDGTSTLYNKAMEEFNKSMPGAAYSFLKGTEGAPSGNATTPGQRVTNFEKLHTEMWKGAVGTVMKDDPRFRESTVNYFRNQGEVYSGKHEISSPFSQ